MRTQHRDAITAEASVAAAMDQHDGNEPAVLLQRVRVAMAIAAGAILLSTIFAVPVAEVRLALLIKLKTAGLALLVAGYRLTRWPGAQRHATFMAWLVPTTMCLMLSLSGILTGDEHGATILCVGIALLTATLFPWGVRAQLATVAGAAGAIAANLYWVPDTVTGSISYEATAGAVLTLAVSVVIIYERRATSSAIREENAACAQAEAQTTLLNERLERVVGERTALLEATRRDLELRIAGHHTTLRMLRDKEQQVRDIVDNSSALIYVKDLQSRYRFVGVQFERRLQIPREEIAGKTAADLFPAEAAAAFEATDRAVLAGNQLVESEDIAPGPSGSRTFLTLKFPLRDADGAPYGLCGISTDITKRKHMEGELRRTEALLASVIESSTEAIGSFDRDYRLTALNSVVKTRFRERFGTDARVGTGLDECVPPAILERWRDRFAQAFTGQSLVVEYPVTLAGTPRQVLVSLTPIREDGAVTGVVFFTKQITGVKRAEERLRQHQAELAHTLRLSTIGEMSTGLAQDLRRPLTTIAGVARACRPLLDAGDFDLSAFAVHLADITAEALGAADRLRHLRHLVRKDSSTRDGIDVNLVTRNAARIVQVGHPNLPLELALAPRLPQVRGDRVQLEQVVLNLLLNALEALQAVHVERRTLAVHTLISAGKAIEVVVRDTGAGVAAGVRDTLFAPFVTTKPRGLGMGLTISRSIVEAHGGELWMTPNPDGGSAFHFTLPLP